MSREGLHLPGLAKHTPSNETQPLRLDGLAPPPPAPCPPDLRMPEDLDRAVFIRALDDRHAQVLLQFAGEPEVEDLDGLVHRGALSPVMSAQLEHEVEGVDEPPPPVLDEEPLRLPRPWWLHRTTLAAACVVAVALGVAAALIAL